MKAELEALLERLEKIEPYSEYSDPGLYLMALSTNIEEVIKELINILLKQDEVHSRV